jgi:hypothetical protein
MRKLIPLVLALALLTPAAAFAGAATDAALGLGAFAVFNQIISGTGIFGALHSRPAIAAPAPVVVAPAPVVVPPPVAYAPPPVVYAPPPVVYAPPPVVYAPPAVVYAPPRVVHRHPRVVYAPVVRRPPVVVAPGHCPPGWAKHGRCRY